MAYHKETMQSPNYQYAVIVREPYAKHANGKSVVEWPIEVRQSLKGSRHIQRNIRIAANKSEAMDLVRKLREVVAAENSRASGYTLRSA